MNLLRLITETEDKLDKAKIDRHKKSNGGDVDLVEYYEDVLDILMKILRSGV